MVLSQNIRADWVVSSIAHTDNATRAITKAGWTTTLYDHQANAATGTKSPLELSEADCIGVVAT